MLLRSKKHWEIKRRLQRPSLLLPTVRDEDIDEKFDVGEYLRKLRTKSLYETYAAYTDASRDIVYNIGVNKHVDVIKDILRTTDNLYKQKLTGTGEIMKKIRAYRLYKSLISSEMYDTDFCKVALMEIDSKLYCGIHIPEMRLSQVNSTNTDIIIKDLYVYINGSSLYGFRTTLDNRNYNFIHPHISQNFSSFCLGESPLKVSMNLLAYENYTEDDVDIFWVNLYRTITQKTEEGNHFYDLDNLRGGINITGNDFSNILKKNPDVLDNMISHLSIDCSKEKLKVNFRAVDFINENKQYFSYEDRGGSQRNSHDLAYRVKFDGEEIKKVKYENLYTGRKLYSGIEGLIDNYIKTNFSKKIIDEFYDDYKKNLEVSNNFGAESTKQDQVLQFQVL